MQWVHLLAAMHCRNFHLFGFYHICSTVSSKCFMLWQQCLETAALSHFLVKDPFVVLSVGNIYQLWQALKCEPSLGTTLPSLTFSFSFVEKISRQPCLCLVFVESCEIIYTVLQGRWSWRCRGQAGGVETRVSWGTTNCSQTSIEQSALVLALYR